MYDDLDGRIFFNRREAKIAEVSQRMPQRNLYKLLFSTVKLAIIHFETSLCGEVEHHKYSKHGFEGIYIQQSNTGFVIGRHEASVNCK